MKNIQDQLALKIAAFLGFAVIAIGAFGAHAFKLKGVNLDWFKTATLYHMFSCVLILFLSLHKCRKSLYCASLGVVIFSGCLYAMALGAPSILGAIVPIGGILMLISWIMLFFSGNKPEDEQGGGEA